MILNKALPGNETGIQILSVAPHCATVVSSKGLFPGNDREVESS